MMFDPDENGLSRMNTNSFVQHLRPTATVVPQFTNYRQFSDANNEPQLQFQVTPPQTGNQWHSPYSRAAANEFAHPMENFGDMAMMPPAGLPVSSTPYYSGQPASNFDTGASAQHSFTDPRLNAVPQEQPSSSFLSQNAAPGPNCHPIRVSANIPIKSSPISNKNPPSQPPLPAGGTAAQRSMVLSELLNSMQQPTVREVDARSALVCIIPPNERRIQVRINERERAVASNRASNVAGTSKTGKDGGTADTSNGQTTIVFEYEFELDSMQFEVRLSEGANNKLKTVFIGPANEIKMEDLKAGTEYYVDVRALLENSAGRFTEAVRFSTAADRPDAPDGLKLVQRGRNYVVLKWNGARANGSKIQGYTVEYSEGKQVDLDVLTAEENDSTNRKIERLECSTTQQRIGRLQGRTSYTVRVAARNGLGLGRFSAAETVATCGDAPERPDGPELVEAGTSWLKLSWAAKNETDEVSEFKLEVEDETTGHGFIPAYCGSESSYVVESLRRNTEYRFRLAATNEVGMSRWSETVAYRTEPEAPRAPSGVEQRGRATQTTATIRWSGPSDAGGLELAGYILEARMKAARQRTAAATQAEWAVVYEGNKCEFQLTDLQPNSTYEVRVRAVTTKSNTSTKTSSGTKAMRLVSEASGTIEVTTQADQPGVCGGLRLLGKAKATTIELRWTRPAYDGYGGNTNGTAAATVSVSSARASVSSLATSNEEFGYEVEMDCEADKRQRRTVYRGSEEECVVAGLTPGLVYQFNVRARNGVGYGPWLSDWYRVETGSSRPLSAPHDLQCELLEETSESGRWRIGVKWRGLDELETGGQPIVDYVLECRKRKLATSGNTVGDGDSDGNGSVGVERLEGEFETVYRGTRTEFAIDGAEAHSVYELRVACTNRLGVSPVSETVEVRTRAGRPNAPGRDAVSGQAIDENRVGVRWRALTAEELNGGTTTGYRIEYRAAAAEGRWTAIDVSRNATEYELDELSANNIYQVRLYVENEHGWSEASPIFQVHTLREPPRRAPSRVQLLTASSNSMRVTWTAYDEEQLSSDRDGVNDSGYTYVVEMRQRVYPQQVGGAAAHYQVVYRGNDTQARIQRLVESSEYELRIRVENERGTSPFSEPVTFRTSVQQPGAVRGLGVRELQANGCVLEWSAGKVKTGEQQQQQQQLVFELQLGQVEGGSGKRVMRRVYRGSETRVVCVGLQASSVYLYRVRAIRVRGAGSGSEAANGSGSELVGGPFSATSQLVTPAGGASTSTSGSEKQTAAQLLSRCGATTRVLAAGYAVVRINTERRKVRLCLGSSDEQGGEEGAASDESRQVWEAESEGESESEEQRGREAEVLAGETIGLSEIPLEQGDAARRPARSNQRDGHQHASSSWRIKDRMVPFSNASAIASFSSSGSSALATRSRTSAGQRSSPSKKKAPFFYVVLKRLRCLIGLELEDDEDSTDESALQPETRFMIFVTVLLLVLAIAFACVIAWYSSVLN